MIRLSTKRVALFCICVFLFFSYLDFSFLDSYGLDFNIYVILGIGIIGIVFLLLRRKEYKISKGVLMPVCVGIFVMIHELLFMDHLLSAFEFSVTILMFSIVYMYIEDGNVGLKKILCRYFFFFSFLHVIAVIIQWIYAPIIMKINARMMSRDSFSVISYLLSQGKFAGVAPQTGTAAYFIIIFLFLCFFKIVIEKKMQYISAEIVGLVALYLTRKRAPILLYSFIVLLFVLFFLEERLRGKNKNIFRLFIFLSTIILGTYVYFIFKVMLFQIDVDEISSGRLSLITSMIKYIWRSPYLGNGFGFIMEKFRMQGHNIYLQLICEYGVFSIIFYIWIFGWLIITYKKFLQSQKEDLFNNAFSLGFQLFFLMYGIFGNPLYDYFELGLYMIIVSISHGDVRREISERKRTKNRGINIS